MIKPTQISADKGLDQHYSMVRAGAKMMANADHMGHFVEIAYSAAATLNTQSSDSLTELAGEKLITHEDAAEIARETVKDVSAQGKRIVDASLESQLLALL